MDISREHPIPNETAFESWWERDGKFIDPDHEEVPWYDKRKELAGMAFVAAATHSRTSIVSLKSRVQTVLDMCKEPVKVDECWMSFLRGNMNGIAEVLEGVEPHAAPTLVPLEAREWLQSQTLEMLLCSHVGASGKYLCELLTRYSTHVNSELLEKLVDRDEVFRHNADLKACNESLGALIGKIWKALEPTGEYEGEKNIVEFAAQVQQCAESAEDRISVLERERDEARKELAAYRKCKGLFLQYFEKELVCLNIAEYETRKSLESQLSTLREALNGLTIAAKCVNTALINLGPFPLVMDGAITAWVETCGKRIAEAERALTPPTKGRFG